MEAFWKAVAQLITALAAFFAGRKYQEMETKVEVLERGKELQKEAEKAAASVDTMSLDDVIAELCEHGRVRD